MTHDTIKLVCPFCGRTQDVDPETYEHCISGHPLTCNGGNTDLSTHHHTVVMQPAALTDSSQYGCPRCGYPIYCGCESCLPGIPDGYKPQQVSDGLLTCANCGLTMGEDAWMDEEIQQALRGTPHEPAYR